MIKNVSLFGILIFCGMINVSFADVNCSPEFPIDCGGGKCAISREYCRVFSDPVTMERAYKEVTISADDWCASDQNNLRCFHRIGE